MTGLLFLGAAIVWFAVAVSLAILVGRRFFKNPWRLPITVGLLIVLVPLPLIDEIVGGMQFKHLCKQHSAIVTDPAKAAGRTVYLLGLPEKYLSGPWVPVRLHPWKFVDVTSREVIVSYDVLYAEGGRLVPRFDAGHEPLTFEGVCAPGGGVRVDNEKLLRDLRMTRVDRPTSKEGGAK